MGGGEWFRAHNGDVLMPLSIMPPTARTAIIAAGAAGPSVIKASAGILYGVMITSIGLGAPGAFDNASAASGTPLWVASASAVLGLAPLPEGGAAFANGLTFAGGATMPAMTIFFA
jgi:hypothetical protein